MFREVQAKCGIHGIHVTPFHTRTMTMADRRTQQIPVWDMHGETIHKKVGHLPCAFLECFFGHEGKKHCRVSASLTDRVNSAGVSPNPALGASQ